MLKDLQALPAPARIRVIYRIRGRRVITTGLFLGVFNRRLFLLDLGSCPPPCFGRLLGIPLRNIESVTAQPEPA
ncbi:hypothetical protein SAMN05444972_110118 [Marininema halotolerans]|uniref:Uncharacterized protein n=1 Tax=Marininema halotolerans TaxID=1155944 RepID=A0A1I6TLT4_9BACL|nr:hypothetical protein SAMN05444972_110118 [Marininema halotolerans]